MPTIKAVLAAALAHANEAVGRGENDFMVVPHFRFPIDATDLELQLSTKAAEFALKVNCIPFDAPSLRSFSDTFVWTAYEQILDNLKRPSSHPTPAAVALAIDAARPNRPLLLPPTEVAYQQTTVIPVDLADPDAWTPMRLNAAQVESASNALAPRYRSLLESIGELTLEPRFKIKEVRFETLVVTVLRPWLKKDFFSARTWDFDEVVSDGGEFPKGKLPSVITKLALVRNFTVALELKDDVVGSVLLEPVTTFVARSPRATERALLLKSVRRIDPASGSLVAPAVQVLSENDGTAIERVAHVPVRFDVSSVQQRGSVEFNARKPRLHSIEVSLTGAKADIEVKKAQIKVIDDELRSLPPGLLGSLVEPALRQKRREAETALSAVQSRAAALEAELAVLHKELGRWKVLVSQADQIAGSSSEVDSDPYVLAMGCLRIPRSPNPDPAFFR